MTRAKRMIPKANKGDDFYALGKAATSVAAAVGGSLVGLPGMGSVAGELYSKILKPPLAKRTEDFLISLNEGFENLEKEFANFNFQDPSKKPYFISAFMQAFQIALRNHQEEKLNALRNAIINIARPYFPEDDVFLMFINWIDTFTPWHIRILKFLDDIEFDDKAEDDSAKHVVDRVTNNFAELRNERAFTNQIIRELDDRGLILKDIDPQTPLEGLGNTYKVQKGYTVQMGTKFLKFIEENADFSHY